MLAKHISQVLVLVDLIIEVELDLVLAVLDQEVADSLGHSVSDVSDDESEVMVDSLSQLHDEDVLSGVLLDRDDVSSVQQVVEVVGEKVALLRLDDVVKDLLSHLSLLLEHLTHDFEDLSNEARESGEDSVSDLLSEVLKVEIDVLEAVLGWVFDPVETVLEEIIEDVDRWESGH